MWKKRLLEFAGQFRHPAWGTDHYERVFRLSLKLAESENQIQQVDADCLLAAAYLHDIGAFPSYKQDGVDHAERSAQAAEEMLAGSNNPRSRRYHQKVYSHIKKILMKLDRWDPAPNARHLGDPSQLTINLGLKEEMNV